MTRYIHSAAHWWVWNVLCPALRPGSLGYAPLHSSVASVKVAGPRGMCVALEGAHEVRPWCWDTVESFVIKPSHLHWAKKLAETGKNGQQWGSFYKPLE